MKIVNRPEDAEIGDLVPIDKMRLSPGLSAKVEKGQRIRTPKPWPTVDFEDRTIDQAIEDAMPLEFEVTHIAINGAIQVVAERTK